MKKLLAALFVTTLSFSAMAQNAVAPCVTTTGPFGNNCSPVTSSNPLPTTGTFTGTVTASIPSVGVNGAASPLSSDQIGIKDGSGNLQAASSANPVPISAASLPIPTGAATASNQTNASQKTQIVDGSGNIIASTSNALNVNLSGSGISNQSVNVNQWGGASTTLGSKLSASSVPVVIASDDMVNTVSAQAARGTGTITNSSTCITSNVSQYSVATVDLSGTYAGITIGFFASTNGGSTYFPILASDSSSSASAATTVTLSANASKLYNVTLPGVTNFEVCSSAYTSGTLNVGITPTADPMVFNVAAGIVGTPTIQGQAASGASTVGNPVRTGANFNTTQPTVTTGQTVDLQATARGGLIVSTGTDTFNATINAALPAGTNLLGKVGIDQTTPGTTNGAAIAQIGATTVLTGGVNGSLGVGGLAANNATASGNPIPVSGLAQSAEASLATNGQNAEVALDLAHKLIVMPFANKENFVSGTATTTSTSDTSLIASAGGSLKNYVTNISCANTGASTSLITFKNGSGGSTLWYTIVPAGGGSNMEVSPPVATSAATAFYFAAGTASTTIYCSATGYKGT